MSARNLLIRKIKSKGPTSYDGLRRLVSLEDFFTGNHDLGSIACNLPRHPGIEAFFEKLKTIRSRPEIQEVLVGITDLMESDEDSWPFSDRIYIVAEAQPDDVSKLVAPLQPHTVFEEIDASIKKRPLTPNTKPQSRVFCVWWD